LSEEIFFLPEELAKVVFAEAELIMTVKTQGLATVAQYNEVWCPAM